VQKLGFFILICTKIQLNERKGSCFFWVHKLLTIVKVIALKNLENK